MGAARTRPRSWTTPAHWLGAARRPPANGAGRAGGRPRLTPWAPPPQGGGGREEDLGERRSNYRVNWRPWQAWPRPLLSGGRLLPASGLAALWEAAALGGDGRDAETWTQLRWPEASYRVRGRPRALVPAKVACVLPRCP